MKLPKRVKVGTVWYDIVIDNDLISILDKTGHHCFGFTEHQKSRIVLDGTLSPTMLKQTLWHEIGHAVWLLAGGQSIDELDEELVMQHMTPLQLLVLVDNPELVYFLLSNTPEPGGYTFIGE